MYSDPSKIQQALGWKAKFTDVAEALRTAWAWRQKNPTGYDNAPGQWNRPPFVVDAETDTQAY